MLVTRTGDQTNELGGDFGKAMLLGTDTAQGWYGFRQMINIVLSGFLDLREK
jgi:hypothetical protein